MRGVVLDARRRPIRTAVDEMVEEHPRRADPTPRRRCSGRTRGATKPSVMCDRSAKPLPTTCPPDSARSSSRSGLSAARSSSMRRDGLVRHDDAANVVPCLEVGVGRGGADGDAALGDHGETVRHGAGRASPEPVTVSGGRCDPGTTGGASAAEPALPRLPACPGCRRPARRSSVPVQWRRRRRRRRRFRLGPAPTRHGVARRSARVPAPARGSGSASASSSGLEVELGLGLCRGCLFGFEYGLRLYGSAGSLLGLRSELGFGRDFGFGRATEVLLGPRGGFGLEPQPLAQVPARASARLRLPGHGFGLGLRLGRGRRFRFRLGLGHHLRLGFGRSSGSGSATTSASAPARLQLRPVRLGSVTAPARVRPRRQRSGSASALARARLRLGLGRRRLGRPRARARARARRPPPRRRGSFEQCRRVAVFEDLLEPRDHVRRAGFSGSIAAAWRASSSAPTSSPRSSATRASPTTAIEFRGSARATWR